MPSSAATHKHSDLEQAMAELARAQARAQADMARGFKELRDRQTQTEANLDRLSAEMREFKDEMGEFKDEMGEFKDTSGRRWGELANKMGTLVEDIVAPGIGEIFRKALGIQEDPECGIRIRRRHLTDRQRMQEYDVLAWNDDILLLNETRSRLRPDDIADLLAMLKEARGFLSEAKGRRLVGSLASFYVDPSLVAAAERQGLLVLGLGRGLLDVLNSPGFKPAEF